MDEKPSAVSRQLLRSRLCSLSALAFLGLSQLCGERTQLRSALEDPLFELSVELATRTAIRTVNLAGEDFIGRF